MQIVAYVRVYTDDQNKQRQIRTICQKYTEEDSNEIEWYCDLNESGASTSREGYQRLREHIEEYDVVVAHELDRLGRSFADLVGFVEDLLSQSTAMVNVDLVMTDREFDSEAVKDICEEYDIYYVNPTRIFINSNEAEIIEWMYRNGKRFHVREEEADDGMPTRKQIYLPK